MKKYFLIFGLISFLTNAQNISVFDNVPFYSMYHYLNQGDLDSEASQNLPPEAFTEIPVGAIRSHAYERDVISRKLTEDEINSLEDNIVINATLFAACDNYDRNAGISIAMVPKGSTSYGWHDINVKRIEIARFVTPFMNKNISPTSVPFSWQINNLSKILKNPILLVSYDFWIEFRVDGYSAAAQTQVAGCTGRNDVFRGKLELVSTNSGSTNSDIHHIEPIKYRFNFNNYQAGSFDNMTTTYAEKNFTITLNSPINDAKLYLVTSKHGSNSGGEEYTRRFHYLYLNDNLVHTYRPNETPSCEPFRVYNTQANGIYGSSPQTSTWWSSWNNWCPGDKIPTKEISLGNLAAGEHTIRLRLSGSNLFNGGQGNVIFSAYLQGINSALSNESFIENSMVFYPNPSSDVIVFQSEADFNQIEIFNNIGQLILKTNDKTISIKEFAEGLYYAKVTLESNKTNYYKIVKK